MPPADSQGNGESQSGSGDPGGGGASVEPVRKAVQLLLVHIPGGIGHGEAKLSLLLLQNQPDAPAGRAVAEGIVQQNGHQLPQETPRTFAGYRRDDGKVGIRNEIWILPTVGCVNGIVTALATEATARFAPRRTKIVAYTHPFGCSQLGEDAERTMELLCGLIRHPNAAGVLVVGLGCENSPISLLQTHLGDYDKARRKSTAKKSPE